MEPIVYPVYEITTTRTKVGESRLLLPQSPTDWPPAIPSFVELVRPFFKDLDHERLIAIYFNEGGQMLGLQTLAEGGRTSVDVDPVEVARACVLAEARAVVLVHNHPHGTAAPSDNDFEVTSSIAKAIDLFGILLADGLIISDTEWVSLRQALEKRRHEAIIRGEHLPNPNEYNLSDPAQRAKCASDLRLSAGAQNDPNLAEAMRLTALAIEGKMDPVQAMLRIEAARARGAMRFDPNGEDGPDLLN